MELYFENNDKEYKDADLKADNDDEEKGEDFQEGEGGLDVASVVSAIESGEISVADMDAILAAVQAAQGGGEEEAPMEDELEEELAPASVPGGEAMYRGVPMNTQVAALWGENESLRADVDAMKTKAQREAQVGSAMQRLEGRPLGADLEERLVAFHADHGSKAFDSYVDGLAKTAGVLPGDDGKGIMFQGQLGKVPEVALKYQSSGTDSIDTAARFAHEWETLHESGHTRMSQERYVDINMAKAGS